MRTETVYRSVIVPLHCHFSEWLTRRTRKDALDRDKVLAISQYHQDMHSVARILAEAVISESATQALVSRYHEQQQAFIDSIETYKSYLFAYRNQHDTLTRLPLRQLLYQKYPGFLSRCQRKYNIPYVLIMDIDRFKSINDTWGHNAGDDVLQQVAQRLLIGSRDTDRLYRFGGEEFILLLEAKNSLTAQSAAGRIRCHLADSGILVSGQRVTVTVVAGLAEARSREELHDVISRADKVMYRGKNNGRNCCVLSSSAADNGTYQIL